jgi:hypothetical protein
LKMKRRSRHREDTVAKGAFEKTGRGYREP